MLDRAVRYLQLWFYKLAPPEQQRCRGVRTAPHHYGAHVGNFITCHLAPAVEHFAFVEWDEVTTPGIDSSHYRIEAGHVLVPELPGFGLALDEDIFANALAKDGYRVGA